MEVERLPERFGFDSFFFDRLSPSNRTAYLSGIIMFLPEEVEEKREGEQTGK